MTQPDELAAVADALTAHFGHQPQRSSVSFVGVEPIEVLRFEPIPGERAYVSLGMSRQPMTPGTADVRAADGPRAELLLYLRDPTDRHAQLWRRLAVLAAAPAVEGVVYTPGMTADVGEPLSPDATCTGVLLGQSAVPAVSTAIGHIEVFELTPATPTELAWCRVHGSTALRDRWAGAGTDLLDVARSPVRLAD